VLSTSLISNKDKKSEIDVKGFKLIVSQNS